MGRDLGGHCLHPTGGAATLDRAGVGPWVTPRHGTEQHTEGFGPVVIPLVGPEGWLRDARVPPT